jgi:hypothetical protein
MLMTISESIRPGFKKLTANSLSMTCSVTEASSIIDGTHVYLPASVFCVLQEAGREGWNSTNS